jgi:DNA-binding LacI/PurR family transcriptional regulator
LGEQPPRETLDPASAVPLWAQLRDALRHRLDSGGEWPAGVLIPRELDLCTQYGVSRITAARAVQELVREGRLRRQRGRGTVVVAKPSGAAASLAFVVPRFDGDWMMDVYGGFEAVVSGAGGFALLTGNGGAPTLSAAGLEALLARQVRGLAVSHLLLDDSARTLLPVLQRGGVPLVFTGTYDPTVRTDRVVADNVRAGRLAAEHLLRLGHRRVAFLASTGPVADRSTSLQGRLQGYREAMGTAVHRAAEKAEAMDQPLAPLQATTDLELLDALPRGLDDAATAEHLLAFLEQTGATAAVTCTDAIAILATRYLRAAGLAVPEHLALVGISDTRFAAVADVPLTTVRINAADLGAGAARLLLGRLEGDRSPPQQTVVPVELIVRASCGARTGEDAIHPYEPVHAAQDAVLALEAALDR